MNILLVLTGFFLSFTSIVALAEGPLENEVDPWFAAFDKNPAAMMAQKPPKWDRYGRLFQRAPTLFTNQEIDSNRFVKKKAGRRDQFCQETPYGVSCVRDWAHGKSPYASHDDVRYLVDNSDTVISDLYTMETSQLRSATLPESPWSDDYWPIYKGKLGKRYSDPSWPADTKDWSVYRNYTLDSKNTATALIAKGQIDRLSPSEKYDLLVGDAEGTLTQQMWANGQIYFDAEGKVETWMGICDGWAAASYMLPRPRRAILALAADGQTWIPFYPSDLKALGSLQWAATTYFTRMVGIRCSQENPAKDKNGRIIDEDCADTNPATWHMGVVNQIGVAKRSMVMDATYDYEVWNQPILGYRYRYFNPQTRRGVNSLEKATIPISSFTKDKFSAYRSEQAAFVTGIIMEVDYMSESTPEIRMEDSPEFDSVVTVEYRYDLELDAQGTIIGGEWYNHAHPDFLWTPTKDADIVSTGDRMAKGAWDIAFQFPEGWKKAALRASQNGQPLSKVVHALFEFSHSAP